MYLAMVSDSVTQGQLYDYASTNVGQRLSILPGVSQVNVYGTKSAIRIKANPREMWARGISIDDLGNAIKKAPVTPAPASWTARPGPRYCARRDSSRAPINTPT
jgi:HAE1 family hydrophobic/amphiphilic exporter-1